MIRILIFILWGMASVHANEIYVEQSTTSETPQPTTTTTTTTTTTPFQEPLPSEKILINNESTQYCSVVAGCFNNDKK